MISIICRKWYDNKPVVLLGKNAEVISETSNVMNRMKGVAATNTHVSCPNIMQMLNQAMGGVDVTDQKKSEILT